MIEIKDGSTNMILVETDDDVKEFKISKTLIENNLDSTLENIFNRLPLLVTLTSIGSNVVNIEYNL